MRYKACLYILLPFSSGIAAKAQLLITHRKTSPLLESRVSQFLNANNFLLNQHIVENNTDLKSSACYLLNPI